MSAAASAPPNRPYRSHAGHPSRQGPCAITSRPLAPDPHISDPSGNPVWAREFADAYARKTHSRSDAPRNTAHGRPSICAPPCSFSPSRRGRRPRRGWGGAVRTATPRRSRTTLPARPRPKHVDVGRLLNQPRPATGTAGHRAAAVDLPDSASLIFDAALGPDHSSARSCRQTLTRLKRALDTTPKPEPLSPGTPNDCGLQR